MSELPICNRVKEIGVWENWSDSDLMDECRQAFEKWWQGRPLGLFEPDKRPSYAGWKAAWKAAQDLPCKHSVKMKSHEPWCGLRDNHGGECAAVMSRDLPSQNRECIHPSTDIYGICPQCGHKVR